MYSAWEKHIIALLIPCWFLWIHIDGIFSKTLQSSVSYITGITHIFNIINFSLMAVWLMVWWNLLIKYVLSSQIKYKCTLQHFSNTLALFHSFHEYAKYKNGWCWRNLLVRIMSYGPIFTLVSIHYLSFNDLK